MLWHTFMFLGLRFFSSFYVLVCAVFFIRIFPNKRHLSKVMGHDTGGFLTKCTARRFDGTCGRTRGSVFNSKYCLLQLSVSIDFFVYKNT
jgi:hypothetical protein